MPTPQSYEYHGRRVPSDPPEDNRMPAGAGCGAHHVRISQSKKSKKKSANRPSQWQCHEGIDDWPGR